VSARALLPLLGSLQRSRARARHDHNGVLRHGQQPGRRWERPRRLRFPVASSEEYCLQLAPSGSLEYGFAKMIPVQMQPRSNTQLLMYDRAGGARF